MNLKNIAYFIGQFPSPSHTYFWREVSALRDLGVSVQFVSTRLPETELAPHTWTPEAIHQTSYLLPFTIQALVGSILLILKAGPQRWWICLDSIMQADGMTGLERFRLVPMVLVGAQVAWLGQKHGWSHIHVGFCADAANVALFAKLLTGLPYSLTLHSALADFGANQRQKWGNAAFGTAVAKNLAVELHEKLGEAVPESLTVVPMGVDTASFQRSKPYEPWDGKQPVRIFCSARLTPRKGQQDLIRAIALLRDHGIPVQLRLAGEDMGSVKWFTEELGKLIRELDLAKVVTLLNTISDEMVKQELELAHIFALASYAEGMSVAVMEAMAMGVPVVVTDVDGLPDLVSDGIDGLLAKPGNASQFCERLYFLLQAPDLAREFSKQAQAKIKRDFESKQSALILLQGIERNQLESASFCSEL